AAKRAYASVVESLHEDATTPWQWDVGKQDAGCNPCMVALKALASVIQS
ncbi:hypothetical protein A2U01_0002684, partial [Trifolium medium]|nr:hypothetical protein [Trifolium medium]